MKEKDVFVLGLPGSGKSTASRYIEMLAHSYGWTVYRLQDYKILYDMFLAEKGKKIRFSSTLHHGYDGFDVHDHSVLDDALKELVRQLQENERSSETNKVNIIEFARDDYCKALEFFTTRSLIDALFLFIDAEIEICKQRIKARIANPQTPDDHYISEYTFEAYYSRDSRQYSTLTATFLRNRFSVGEEKVKVVDNTDGVSKQVFLAQINNFITPVLHKAI